MDTCVEFAEAKDYDMPKGDKIKNTPAEKVVIELFGQGKGPYAIRNKLLKDHDIDITEPTIKAYIENYIINDEEIKKQLNQHLAIHQKEIDALKKDVPDAIINLITKKENLIQELRDTLEEMTGNVQPQAMLDNDYLNYIDKKRKILMDVHSVQNYQNQFLVEFNMNDLLNKFAGKLIGPIFDILIPRLQVDGKEDAIAAFKRAYVKILEDFKIDTIKGTGNK